MNETYLPVALRHTDTPPAPCRCGHSIAEVCDTCAPIIAALGDADGILIIADGGPLEGDPLDIGL